MNEATSHARLSGPIPEQDRNRTLDAVRGLALLGILMVNIALMAEPLGTMMQFTPRADEGPLESATFYLTKIFAESKSYPLFSMLFGIGLAMTWQRARDRGTGCLGNIARRQIALLIIGLLHVVLLWFGDILAFYGVIGLIALIFAKCKARTLAVLAACSVGFSVLLAGAFGTLGAVFQPQTPSTVQVDPMTNEVDQSAPTMAELVELKQRLEQEQTAATVQPTGESSPEPAPAQTDTTQLQIPAEDASASTPSDEAAPFESQATTPFARLMEGFSNGSVQNINDPLWMQSEREAMTHGPFSQALAFRLLNYGSALVFWMLLSGGAFHILGMFLLGMAIYKAGWLDPAHRAMRLRTAAVAFVIGLPIAIFTAFAPALFPDTPLVTMALVPVLTLAFGPLISLFYLTGVGVLVDLQVLKPIIKAVSNMGRLALTNYLMQTILVAVIMSHWGLGMYGQLDRAERLGLVLSIYAFQLVFSALWLIRYRMGPFEWFLRSITYAKLQKAQRKQEPVNA